MQLLLQILYIFRTVPLPIPQKFLHNQQSTLSRFLWEGKKARSAFSKLSKTRREGGVGLPVLADYHMAALLAHIRGWFPNQSMPPWGLMEQTQIPGGDLHGYILAYPYLTAKPTAFSLPVLATLESWKKLVSFKYLLTPTIHLEIPITTIALIIPELNLTKWESLGIKWVLDLFVGTTMESFTHLQLEYSLPASDQFNYICVASYLKSSNYLHCKLFWKIHTYLTARDSRKGGISLFYNFLNNKFILVKTNSMLAWERDFATSYTEEQWHKALQHTHSAIKCTNLWQL